MSADLRAQWPFRIAATGGHLCEEKLLSHVKVALRGRGGGHRSDGIRGRASARNYAKRGRETTAAITLKTATARNRRRTAGR